MAHASGKEASLHAASCQLQALLDDGDQPKGCLFNQLCVILLMSLPRTSKCCIFLVGACESTSCRSHLCVRAPPWCQGQHAENLQQHPRSSHVQGRQNRIYFYQKPCIRCTNEMLMSFVHRLPMSVPVSTSCWPGSTQSFRNVCVTRRWAGPRNTSLESLTCALPAILSTPGLMTLLRFEGFFI